MPQQKSNSPTEPSRVRLPRLYFRGCFATIRGLPPDTTRCAVLFLNDRLLRYTIVDPDGEEVTEWNTGRSDEFPAIEHVLHGNEAQVRELTIGRADFMELADFLRQFGVDLDAREPGYEPRLALSSDENGLLDNVLPARRAHIEVNQIADAISILQTVLDNTVEYFAVERDGHQKKATVRLSLVVVDTPTLRRQLLDALLDSKIISLDLTTKARPKERVEQFIAQVPSQCRDRAASSRYGDRSVALVTDSASLVEDYASDSWQTDLLNSVKAIYFANAQSFTEIAFLETLKLVPGNSQHVAISECRASKAAKQIVSGIFGPPRNLIQ